MRTTTPQPDGTLVTAPATELDLLAVSELRTRLTAAHRPGATVVLDLQGVVFMDSSALSVVLAADRRLQVTGGGLRLLHVADEVRRVLRIVGLAGLVLPEPLPQRLRRRCAAAHLRHRPQRLRRSGSR